MPSGVYKRTEKMRENIRKARLKYMAEHPEEFPFHQFGGISTHKEDCQCPVCKKKRGEYVEPWNKGLTAETDERVAENVRNFAHWSKGLTEETDERVARNAEAQRKNWEDMDFVMEMIEFLGSEEFSKSVSKGLKKYFERMVAEGEMYRCSICSNWCGRDVYHWMYSRAGLLHRGKNGYGIYLKKKK